MIRPLSLHQLFVLQRTFFDAIDVTGETSGAVDIWPGQDLAFL
jgi:hypothetical protein